MTIMQLIRLGMFRQSSRFALALAPTPLHEDSAIAGSEAEYWLDVCHANGNTRLVNNWKARSMLADAAAWHATTGYNQRLYKFNDESKLLISPSAEVVM